jgi:hypothetical protein
MQFTDVTVWLAMATMLSVFQISKADSEDKKASAFTGLLATPFCGFVFIVPYLVIEPRTQSHRCQSSTEVQVQDQPAV